MEKIVYWFTFLFLDSVILLAFYVMINFISKIGKLLICCLVNSDTEYMCSGFNGDLLPLSFMSIYIVFYVLAIYLLANIIKNYLLFIFIFFFLNGFSFYSV